MNLTNGIEIQDLSWAYGPKPVLHHIDLSIRLGRFTVLLGPNGAGKSTLVALLSGLIATDQGKIYVRSHDLSKQTHSALALMGFVFQQQTLDLDLNVQQNMSYFAAIRGISRKQAQLQIQDSLKRMGLSDRTKEKVRLLNGGHRRRLEIARALVHTPEILILDEPTTGLDLPSRNGLVKHIHSLCADEGYTVLWATHLVDEVWEDDDLIVLDQGRVKIEGPVRKVLADTGTETVLDAFNQLTNTEDTASTNPQE